MLEQLISRSLLRIPKLPLPPWPLPTYQCINTISIGSKCYCNVNMNVFQIKVLNNIILFSPFKVQQLSTINKTVKFITIDVFAIDNLFCWSHRFQKNHHLCFRCHPSLMEIYFHHHSRKLQWNARSR